MAFPTSPSNNQVHAENNRSYVYDSTLGVWDRIPEFRNTITSQLGELHNLNDPTEEFNLGSQVKFPEGHIIQVKYYSFATEQGNSTSTWKDTGLRGTITPSWQSNKILAMFTLNGVGKETSHTSTDIQAVWRISDGAFSNNIGYGSRSGMTGDTSKNNVGTVAGMFVVSPNTQKSVDFKLHFRSSAGNANAQVHESNATSQLILMEVVG